MKSRFAHEVTLILAVPLLAAGLCCGQDLTIAPDRSDGVYQVGDTVHWTVHWNASGAAPAARFALKSGGLKEVGRGDLKFNDNAAMLESKFDAPGTMLVEVDWEPKDPKRRAVGGAA